MPTAYPLVFHCFAGKDRTGILTALVLGLLGVADDDIAADYALSEAAMHRLLRLAASTGPATERHELESSAAAIVAAEPEDHGCSSCDRFRAAHGSFEAYAATLGQPGAAIRRSGSCSSPNRLAGASCANRYRVAVPAAQWTPGQGARRRILAMRSVR